MRYEGIGRAVLAAITIGIAIRLGAASAVFLWVAAAAIVAALLLPIWLLEHRDRALWGLTAAFAGAAGLGSPWAWAILALLLTAAAIDWLLPAGASWRGSPPSPPR